jgi:hypothetical protein
MKTPIVTQLSDIRNQVRKQDFKWTPAQRERYATLIEQRYTQIAQWREEGRVWVGPSNIGKETREPKTDD